MTARTAPRGLTPWPAAVGLLGLMIVLGGCGQGQGGEGGSTAQQGAAQQAALKERVPKEGDLSSANKEPKERGARALADLPRTERAENAAVAPKIVGVSGLPLEEALNALTGDIATFWQEQFNAAGYEFEPATVVAFEETVPSACGDPPDGLATADGGPFYCPRDLTVNLPIPFFEKEQAPIGDSAVAVVVAHEVGHHIENVMGIMDRADAGELRPIDVELTADCLAGNWMSSTFDRQLLEEGDIEEALTSLAAAEDPPGTEEDSSAAHGTAEQRNEAFAKGYENGDPGDCVP